MSEARRKSKSTTKIGFKPKIDPITLSVIRGVLETTQREMTLSLEKTARSSVFNLAHDYSTALLTARANSIAFGVSECTQIQSARTFTSLPLTDTATPSRTARNARSAARLESKA